MTAPEEVYARSRARLRRRSERNMPFSVVISRPTLVDDGAGGREKTTSVVASGVRCRVENVGEARDITDLSPMVQVLGQTQRLDRRKTWYVCVPWGTNVLREDQMVVTDDNGVQASYSVMDVLDRLTTEAHLIVLVLEL